MSEIKKTPEDWMAIGKLAKEIRRSEITLEKVMKPFLDSHPEWLLVIPHGRRKRRFIHPELASHIRDKINETLVPEGWMTIPKLAKELKKDRATVEKIMKPLLEGHPEWQLSIPRGEKSEIKYFHPKLVKRTREKVDESLGMEPAPEGWITNATLAKELGTHVNNVSKVAKSLSKNPEHFQVFLGHSNKPFTHYHPELIALIRKEITKAPEGWLTSKKAAKELVVSQSYFITTAKEKCPNEEWIKMHLTKEGHFKLHYHPQLIEMVKNREADSEITNVPEGWMTNHQLAEELEVAEKTIKTRSDEYRASNPEWFKDYKSANGHENEYYHPSLVELIKKEFESKKPPKGWMTANRLSTTISLSSQKIKKIANTFRGEHPEWFKELEFRKGQIIEYYHPDLITLIKKEVPQQAPDNWITLKDLATKCDTTLSRTRYAVAELGKEHPNWHGKYSRKSGAPGAAIEYCHPKLADMVRLKLSKEKQIGYAPEGWMTNSGLSTKLSFYNDGIKELAEKYRAEHPEWFRKYLDNSNRIFEYYHPELVILISSEVIKLQALGRAPEGWMTNGALAELLDKDNMFIQAIANPYLKKYPEWSRKHLTVNNRPLNYYHPDLIAIIKEIVEKRERTKENMKKSQEEREQLQKNLRQLFEDIKTGATPDGRVIRALIEFFAGSNFIDVLFMHHPQYRKLGAEYVGGEIGEYLGDFLVNVRPTTTPPDIKLPKTLKPELEEVVFANLKNEAFTYCNKRKREGVEESELDMILNFLASKENEINQHPCLRPIKERIIEYYSRLFDLKKPDNMVDSLTENREFPDLNQLVNIMEMYVHRQILIADEMGLGKSNSAISTKEFLGLKRALVIVPSNIIDMDTWQDYLSDKVDKDGNQIGYFKPGQTPKVLVIESVEDITKAGDYDYVLMSQGRLTEEYTDVLLEVDFDYMIIDEIHKLKNIRKGKRSKNLVRLGQNINEKNGYLSLLSGTPVPNKIQDVAMIIRLLYPNRYASLSDDKLVLKVIHGDLLELKGDLNLRMQMKELAMSIELPERTDEEIWLEFSPEEEALYEALHEEDELTAKEKMDLLRRFCISHQSLEVAPTIPSTKLNKLNKRLNEILETGGSAIVYVNDFVEGILRKDKWASNTILDHLSLPPNTEVHIIDGSNKNKRKVIQQRLNENGGNIVVFAHGMAADVGVSFVGATNVIHLNDPWTKFDKDQQIARTYRPRLDHPIRTTSIRMKNSFEEAQADYMEKKYKAIMKLLRCIPISEMNKRLLEEDATTEKKVAEQNPELAKEYLSKVQRYNRMFGSLKQIGEKRFKEFLEENADLYAESYRVLGTRSYHGNNVRVTSALLNAMIKEKEQEMESVQILDVASGPKMLQRHSDAELGSRIASIDINPLHFKSLENKDNAMIGSFLDIPVESGSLDYCTMGFALDYTRLVKRENNYERIQVLAEMNRVLKTGGRAIISTVYSTTIRNPELFKQAVDALGFRIVEKYTGEASSGNNYSANYFTLEKVRDIECSNGAVDMETILTRFENGNIRGLKFKEDKKKKIKKQRHMIDEVTINGSTYDIRFSHDDQMVKDEETKMYREIEKMIEQYGDITKIPVEVLQKTGYTRYRIGEDKKAKTPKYRLFKSFTTASGVMVA